MQQYPAEQYQDGAAMLAREFAKSAPSIGAIVLGWLDAPLATWQIRIGIAFILLQAAHLIWRWWRDARRKE